jgi:hypothetical protein
LKNGVPPKPHGSFKFTFAHFSGTKSRFSRDLSGWDYAWDVQMPGRQIKSESVMAGLYLGIAVTSVNALVATGLVIAFM